MERIRSGWYYIYLLSKFRWCTVSHFVCKEASWDLQVRTMFHSVKFNFAGCCQLQHLSLKYDIVRNQFRAASLVFQIKEFTESFWTLRWFFIKGIFGFNSAYKSGRLQCRTYDVRQFVEYLFPDKGANIVSKACSIIGIRWAFHLGKNLMTYTQQSLSLAIAFAQSDQRLCWLR